MTSEGPEIKITGSPTVGLCALVSCSVDTPRPDADEVFIVHFPDDPDSCIPWPLGLTLLEALHQWRWPLGLTLGEALHLWRSQRPPEEQPPEVVRPPSSPRGPWTDSSSWTDYPSPRGP